MEENVKNTAAEEIPVEQPQVAVPDDSDLQKKLDEMTAQYNQMREVAARAQADGINYRNWAEREMKRLKAYGSERAVVQLLPVLDNLDRAVGSSKADAESIINGVKMVQSQFSNALKNLGVTELDPTGEMFSPLSHDAMGMAPVTDKEQDGRVVAVVQKGYKMADKVIRPAMVMVGRYTEPAQEKDPPEEDKQ